MPQDSQMKLIEENFQKIEFKRLVSNGQVVDTNYFELCDESFAHLEKVFNEAFKNLKDEIEAFEGKQFNILSLACGGGVELYFLRKFLGKKLFDKVNYVGIDLAGDRLGFSDLNKALMFSSVRNAKFYTVDATKVEDVSSKFSGKINFIILRHPQFITINLLGTWCPFRKILREVIPQLSLDANVKLLITTFFEREKEIAMACLKASAEICNENYQLANGLKMFSTDDKQVGSDKYIIAVNSYQPALKKRANHCGFFTKTVVASALVTGLAIGYRYLESNEELSHQLRL